MPCSPGAEISHFRFTLWVPKSALTLKRTLQNYMNFWPK